MLCSFRRVRFLFSWNQVYHEEHCLPRIGRGSFLRVDTGHPRQHPGGCVACHAGGGPRGCLRRRPRSHEGVRQEASLNHE